MGFFEKLFSEEKKFNLRPVCLLKDHFDIARSAEIYENGMDEFEKEKDLLIERIDKFKAEFFTKLRVSLIEKGLVSKEQLERSKGEKIQDGVVFLYMPKEVDDYE